MINPAKFNKAYELRSSVLNRLQRLVVNGDITTVQYQKRVINANMYVLRRGK